MALSAQPQKHRLTIISRTRTFLQTGWSEDRRGRPSCPSGSCSPNPAETAAHSRTSPTHRGGTPMAEPVLKKGSNDPAVRDLQVALKALGYDPGPIDSVFGAKTETAVKKFQQTREIPVDGVVGRVTWINIDEADQSHPVLKAGATCLPVR